MLSSLCYAHTVVLFNEGLYLCSISYSVSKSSLSIFDCLTTFLNMSYPTHKNITVKVKLHTEKRKAGNGWWCDLD